MSYLPRQCKSVGRLLFKTQPIGNLKINLTPLVTVDDGRDRKKRRKNDKKDGNIPEKKLVPGEIKPLF